MKKIQILVLGMCIVLSACEKESGCDSCQAAIDHMAGKIANYNCDPFVMQNAWDKINASCGAMGDTYVGYMAETCSNGELIKPICGSSLYIRNLKFNFYSISGVPDELDIVIQYTGSYGSENIRFVNKQTSVVIPNPIEEDVEFTFSIYKVSELIAITSASNTLRFNRKDIWAFTRGVQINYDPTKKEYSLDFDNW